MQRCYRDFSTPFSPVRAEPCPTSLLEPVRPRSVPRRNPSGVTPDGSSVQRHVKVQPVVDRPPNRN